MEDIKKIYQDLTQNNIDEQRRIWDERGKGYYGEYLVLKELFFHICPPCKFLMNLEIPTKDGKTTEIDLLMIHPTGIYVFEIKHYKGIIYGNVNDNIWTQFFRTQENHTFKNPFKQNAYHLRALKELFPHTELHSIVVFTNEDCELKIKNDNHELILCTLRNLLYNIDNICKNHEHKYSINDIEKRFYTLKDFSKISSVEVEQIDDQPLQFYEFLNMFKENFEKAKDTKLDEFHRQKELLETEYEKKTIALKKEKKRNLMLVVLGIVICLIASILICFSVKTTCDSLVNQAEKERILMEQKFQHVDETNIPYNDIINSCLTVNHALQNSSIKNTVQFKGEIKLLTKEYGIRLNENSKYIVIKSDGTSYQYDIFDSKNQYHSFANTLYPNGNYSNGKLRVFNFIGVGDSKDITYIKMTNVTLFDATNYSYPSYADNLEIEIYSAE